MHTVSQDVAAPRGRFAVLIPALEPPPSLVPLVQTLLADARVGRVLVVDDGSSEKSGETFATIAALPRAEVVRHPVNQGKGVALKTGLRHLLRTAPDIDAVITADADGQHLPDDILRVGAASLALPHALLMGVRDIGAAAPLRSRFGNRLTRDLFHLLVGHRLRDTQSGLRGIPRELVAPLAELTGTGYEYELNMLIWCRQASVPVVEEPIASVYVDGNRSSHFKPVRDSLRIYSVLLKFGAVSLSSALIDNAVFVGGLALGLGSAGAFLTARLASASFNYPVVRRWVFPQAGGGAAAGWRYGALLVLNLLSAGLLGSLLQRLTGLEPLTAKAIVETLLFLPNFLVQRDVVFRSSRVSATTDWNSYYASRPFTARCTRRYTNMMIAQALREVVGSARVRQVVELGGGRSCFLDRVCRLLRPESYTVVDSNAVGLSGLAGWTPPHQSSTSLVLHEADVRAYQPEPAADLAFSVGLIEHFDPADTARVLRTHFDLVRSGGVVLVSYPTPTLLYRATRGLLERLGLWNFPDERPLCFAETAATASPLGDLVWRRTLWPLMLSQEMLVFRKR